MKVVGFDNNGNDVKIGKLINRAAVRRLTEEPVGAWSHLAAEEAWHCRGASLPGGGPAAAPILPSRSCCSLLLNQESVQTGS